MSLIPATYECCEVARYAKNLRGRVGGGDARHRHDYVSTVSLPCDIKGQREDAVSPLLGHDIWRLAWPVVWRVLPRELLVFAGEEEAGEGLGIGDLAAGDQDRQLGEVDLFEADRLVVH